MRRVLVVCALASGAICASAMAQSRDTVTLAPLRAPGAPALSILGIEPSAIQRPATPRAVAANLLSATSQATVIPDNYALEIAPYWLLPHPMLTHAEYFAGSGRAAWVQTLSFSLGTSHHPVETRDSATAIALGVRVVPLRGRPSAAARRFNDMLDTALLRKAELIMPRAELGDSLVEARNALQHVTNDSVARALTLKITRVEAALRALDARLNAAADTVARLASQLNENDRVGPMLELALAGSALYPNNAFDEGRLARLGAWATFGYRAEHPQIDFLALGRYQHHQFGSTQNLIDAGGRAVAHHGPLGLSGEIIYRAASNAAAGTAVAFKSSTRSTMLIEYRAGDDLYLFAGFGRDFERAAARDTHPLFSHFGVQVNWGRKPKFAVKES